MAVTYVRNRTTFSSIDESVTAIQRLTGDPNPPSLAHLRVWGCTAYARVGHHVSKAKYDPVATKFVFVGYEHPLGYRLMSPSTLQVLRTRHVTFLEDDFSAMRELAANVQPSAPVDSGDEDDDLMWQNEIEQPPAPS